MIQLNDLVKQYHSVKTEIDTAIQSVIDRSAFIGNWPVESFEEKFADYVGAEYCIAVANGTDALEIILESLMLNFSEMVVPALTAAPTAEAVIRSTNVPIFCDVDASGTIDINELRGLPKYIKAIIPVHMYGIPADMPSICMEARQRRCMVIEDCAQAHGTRIYGRHVGTFGIAGAFSFYPSKNLGCFGDGGAIITNDTTIATRCRAIRNHGRTGKYDHNIVGRNSRLDGIQAAILSVKLDHLDEWNALRVEHASRYTRHVNHLGSIVENSVCSFHQFPALFEDRDAAIAAFASKGIQTGMHYPFIIPELVPYRQYAQQQEFAHAEYISKHELSIPVHEMLSDEQVDAVIETLVSLRNG